MKNNLGKRQAHISMSDKKYYQTKEFQNLKNEWYAKLDDSGFDDIEKHEKSETSVTPQEFQSKATLKNRQTALAVQDLLGSDFELEKFNDGSPKTQHKTILELYAQGRTTREISAHLKTLEEKYHMGFQGVARVIERYLKRFKG